MTAQPMLPGDAAVFAAAVATRDGRRTRLVDATRANVTLTVGIGVCAFLVLAAAFGPLLLPDPSAIDANATLMPPSPGHPFGTDPFGRDILSRVATGARTSLLLAAASASLAALVGVPLGLVAGYFGGRTDSILMRTLDAILAFPVLLLALFVVAALGPGAVNLTLSIGFVFIPYFARLVRAQTMRLREAEFVSASSAYGTTTWRLLTLVILPNCLAPILVQFSMAMGFALLTEAGLSFLGLGVQPPDPAWGLMLKESQIYMQQAPWYTVAPGLAILVAVLGFNLVGDGLRDLFDPGLRR